MSKLPDIRYRMIDSPLGLEHCLKKLENEKSIAVDVESDSLYHFQERVCLIQISTSDKIFIIDPLTIKEVSSLKPLFFRKDIRKIFHGADYDIRSLYRDFGIEINTLFDTQLAAMFLGINETSLEALIQDRFHIHLNKKYQKKDWSKRPLPDEMLSYAAMDAMYLLPLSEQLSMALKRMNRLYWVEEEAELLSRVRPATMNRNPLFLKFKGAGKLSPRSLAVLESLLSYRKKIAEKRDKPLYKIIGNSALIKIAVTLPSDMNSLGASGALSQKQIHMYGNDMMAAVQHVLKIPKGDLPAYPRKKRPVYQPGVAKRIKALKSWRDTRAIALKLNPALVFSNALIRTLATQHPETMKDLSNINGIKKWQVAEFSEEILHVLKKSNHGKTRKFTGN